MKVVWIFKGEDFAEESTVQSATDFLLALKAVDYVSHSSGDYKVANVEMVISPEPYITVVLE